MTKKLPKSLTRVTAFSKALAFVLILAFIAAAFYAGMQFSQKYADIAVTLTPTPTPALDNRFSCSVDSDCVFTVTDIKNSCCPNIRCLHYADDGVVVVNRTWLNLEQNAICGVRKMCPMIAALCTKTITEENNHYSVKCMQRVCKKVQS